MINDPNAFALAVIQSSDSKLSVDEKITLYIEAKEKAKEYNKNNPSKGATRKSYFD